MKFKVDVSRVGYSNGFLVINIPEDKIPRNKRGSINQRKLTKMVEDQAIDHAGGESFCEHDADYSVQSVEKIGD
jgi:hypothetical protein